AKAAFPAWAATPPAERRAYVEKILEIAKRRRAEMGEAISVEMGAPIDLATNVQAGVLEWHTQDFLNAFDQIHWLRPHGDGTGNTMIAMEPIGVVGLITPWNWPMNQVALKVI